MKTGGFSGRVVLGTVTKVLPFAAFLRLPDVIGNGYLSISQVSEERLEPPLTNALKEGDTIEVLVKWFDEKHNAWETSHKAILQRQHFESIGLTTPGARISATVVRADETKAILNIEGVHGYIYGRSSYAWNAYNVLYEAGYIAPEKSVEVVIEGWEAPEPQPRLCLYLGEPLKIVRGTICDGKVIFIRKVVDKKTGIHDDLYVRLVGGEIAWIRLKDVMSADITFPVGSTIPLIVGKFVQILKIFEAKVEWNRANIPARRMPELGTVVDVKVTSVRPSFAICLISDRVAGVLPHSTIIKEKSGDTRQHLHPGDIVKVVVEQLSERGAMLRFLQLVESIVEPTESSDLVDLRVARRAGGASGFQRDQQFRRNVLDAFDHTCCVCGVRYVFGIASAMEAAHIIPRASRGADTTRNSLCLCSLHHWAFDRGFLTIDESWRVVIARQITDLGASASPLASHHGNNIHVADPTMISFDAINWHRQNVFLDDYRLVREPDETDYGIVS